MKSGVLSGYQDQTLAEPANELVPYVNELIRTDLIIKDGTEYAIRDKIIKEYLRMNYGGV